MFICDGFCNCHDDDCLSFFDTFDRSNLSNLWYTVTGSWSIVDEDWLTCDSTSGELQLVVGNEIDGEGFRWSVWAYGEAGATLRLGSKNSGQVVYEMTVTFGSDLLQWDVYGIEESCPMTKAMPAEQWVELSFCHFDRKASGGYNNAMFYIDGEQVWGTGRTRSLNGLNKIATTGEVYLDDLYAWNDDRFTSCNECNYCWYFDDKFSTMNFRLTVSGHADPILNGEFILTRKVAAGFPSNTPCNVYWSDSADKWTLKEQSVSGGLSAGAVKINNYAFLNPCGFCEVSITSGAVNITIKCFGSGAGTGGQADVALIGNQSTTGGAGVGGSALVDLIPSGVGGVGL